MSKGQRRFTALMLVAVLAAAPLGANELRLGREFGIAGGGVEVPVLVVASTPLQGFVAAFEWNGAVAAGREILAGKSIEGASFVNLRIERDHAVVAVLIDFDPADGRQILPEGSHTVATARLGCVEPDTATPLVFTDGKYAVSDGSPLQDNHVIVEGRFIGRQEGLLLTDGDVRCVRGGLQVPGDCNQDGNVDLSDPICALGILFQGAPLRLPCGEGRIDDPGNLALLDWQPDGGVDISDVAGVLRYLFLGGPPHPLAIPGNERRGRVPLPDCPDL